MIFRASSRPAPSSGSTGDTQGGCPPCAPGNTTPKPQSAKPQSAKPLPRLTFSSYDLAYPRPPRPCPSPCESATNAPPPVSCESALTHPQAFLQIRDSFNRSSPTQPPADIHTAER